MFETDRLILRKLQNKDIDDIFAMRKDPEVMKYIRKPQTDRLSSIKWITMMTERWDTDKIGFCGVIEKDSGAFVGWCGLWILKETDEIEIGYAIAKQFWGNGFATEAAYRCLEYGFNELNLMKIVAVSFPQNIASQNVMKKLGMKFVRTGTFYGYELIQFAIFRDEFLRRND